MTRLMPSAFTALLAAATIVLVVPRTATADAKAEAEKHFKAGVSLLEVEDWPAAAAEFETSVQLFPTKMGLFNLANTYRAMHRYQEALDTVDRIEREFSKKLDPEFKDALAEFRREIRGMVGRLSVRVEEAGAEVRVDGRVVGKSPLESIALGPGEHHVQISLAGFATQQRAFRITAGETAKESFNLERDGAVAAVTPVPAPTPTPTADPAPPAAGTLVAPAAASETGVRAAGAPMIKPVESAPTSPSTGKPSNVDVGSSNWTIDQAIAALHSPDKQRRIAGLHRIANEPGPRIQMRIAALARFDGEPRIRYDAVKALGTRRESASLPILRTIAVNDADGKVRAAARLALSTIEPPSIGGQSQGQAVGQGGTQQFYDGEGTVAVVSEQSHPYAFFSVMLTGTIVSGIMAAGFGIAAAEKDGSGYASDQATADSYKKTAVGFGVTTGVFGLAAIFGMIGGYYKEHSVTEDGKEPAVSAAPGGLAVSF